MPVIPVIAAVYSVATAASVGFAALSTFQVIATVSSVVGAIGAVTKNKTLSMIGLVGGAVGGIGTFAQASGMLEGVGLAAESGEAFNKAFTSGAVFKGGAETAGSVATGAPAGGAWQAGDRIDAAAGGAWQAGDRIDAAGAAAETAPVAATSPVPVSGDPVGPQLTAVQRLAEEKAAKALADASGANGLWGSFQSFAEKNPGLTFTGLTTAGSALAGLFDPTADSTAEKNEAEAAVLRNQSALQARQMANMAAPLPSFLAPQQPAQNTVGYTIDPVTGKAVAPGLINAVTGVPA